MFQIFVCSIISSAEVVYVKFFFPWLDCDIVFGSLSYCTLILIRLNGVILIVVTHVFNVVIALGIIKQAFMGLFGCESEGSWNSEEEGHQLHHF